MARSVLAADLPCSVSPWLDLSDIFGMITDPIGQLVKMIAELVLVAAIKMFAEFTGAVPTLGQGPGSEASVPVMISDQVEWLVVYVAVGSIIFAAAKMALDRRGEAGKTAIYGFLRVILVAGAGTWIATKAAALSDRYASYLLNDAAMTILKGIPCISEGTSLEGFLLLVIALLLLLSGIVHVLMLYIRLGVMVILLGTLPLAAAASMTNWGATWWRKHIGWTIAWLLYKPAVGLIIYSGAEMLAQGNRTGWVHGRIAGAGILLLSAVAMPALLRLIVPATSALGTGNPTGAAASMATSAVASGAKKVAGSAASHGGGGGGGPSGSRNTGGGGGSSGRGPAGSSSQGGSGSSGGSGQNGFGLNGSSGSDGGSGSSGGTGSSGSSGRNGTGGHDGLDGRDGLGGSHGSGGATGGSGSSGAAGAAARAAGPIGMAIEGAHRAGQIGKEIATGSISGGRNDRDGGD